MIYIAMTLTVHWKDKIFLFPTRPKSSLYLIRNRRYDRNTLAATVHIFSDISGSHFNPAVSLAMFVVQRISLTRMFLYWIMQILGALLAIAILDACELKMGETHLNSDTVNVGQGFLFELFGTLLWVYVALAATNELRGTVKSNIEYPLYVGLAFILLQERDHSSHNYSSPYSISLKVPLTGCGLNPPRSLLANAFFDTIEGYDWVYVVAPLVAAVLGGFSYELIFSNYYTDLSSSYMKNSKPINSIPKHLLLS
eukprot:sb/3468625/